MSVQEPKPLPRLTTLPPIISSLPAPSHQLPSLPEILSQLRGNSTPAPVSVPATRSNSSVSDDALVAAVSLSRLSGGQGSASAQLQARLPPGSARNRQAYFAPAQIEQTNQNHFDPSSFSSHQNNSANFSSPQKLDSTRYKTIMSWLDQYGLNQIPAEVAAEPEWAASVLGSASAAELAQAQAELDMWSTMAFNGDDPFGSNQQGPPKETTLPGLASLPWGDVHDSIFAKEDHTHAHSHGPLHHSPISLFASLAHSAPPTVSQFNSTATVSPPETHSASHSAANSPPASRPSTGRKRSLSQANLHAPPSPLPSDTGSGSRSNSGSTEEEKTDQPERTGPLSEADKRKRNTEASARFRAKKRAREAQLRQNTTVLAERVANLEKIADSLRAENRFLRGIVADKHSR